MKAMFAHFPNGVPERINCFFHGLTMGWVVSEVIGHADADEVKALLPERSAEIFDAIPYGPKDVADPEFASLTADEIPDGLWFDVWNIRKCPRERFSRGSAFCLASLRAAGSQRLSMTNCAHCRRQSETT